MVVMTWYCLRADLTSLINRGFARQRYGATRLDDAASALGGRGQASASATRNALRLCAAVGRWPPAPCAMRTASQVGFTGPISAAVVKGEDACASLLHRWLERSRACWW